MRPKSNIRSQRVSSQSARIGDTRRFVAAVFGVWAMVLQSMLPFAGALAAGSEGGIWVALCTSAGIENIYLGDDAADAVDQKNSGAACNACAVCACSTGAGCGCGSTARASERIVFATAFQPPPNLRLISLGYFEPHPTRAPPA